MEGLISGLILQIIYQDGEKLKERSIIWLLCLSSPHECKVKPKNNYVFLFDKARVSFATNAKKIIPVLFLSS
jgi:hypothetical protein